MAEDPRRRGYDLQSEGRLGEAIACYEQVVARDPRDWEIWNNLGNARRDAGDLAGAIDALTIARELRPDLAAIHYNLGVGLAQAGQLAEAARAFGEAVRLAPDHPAGLLALGSVLRQLGRHAEALAPLERAAGFAPAAAEIRIELGRALSGLGRFEQADAAYRDALAAAPGLAAAFLERGLLLERGNRLERLPALLDEAAAAGVSADDLSYLRALALEREGRLDAALDAAKAADDPARAARLIGRLADRAGDASAAFAAFRALNALAGEGWAERAAAYRAHVAALRDMMSADYVAGWSTLDLDSHRPAPVFLVGFPRSGTTLLDTLLMGHPDVLVLEEAPILQRVGEALGDFARLPDLRADEANALRALYFSELDALDPAAGGKLVVDKLPLNILGAPLIHRLFPEAKLIFAQRHPCDVVLSCFMQDFDLNDAMANFLDLGDAARLYDLVLDFWTRSRALLPLDVHALRYESLVADKEREMRSLIAFLGLAWNDGALDNEASAIKRGPIATPSYHQVVQPIYARAAGRWERYRAEMAGVLPILAPWAERMDYRI
jgi:tetratricopeptide (TPR) repeat protein